MEIYLRDFLWERNKMEGSDSHACIRPIRIYEKQSKAIMLPWQIIRACNSLESNAKQRSDESAGLVCPWEGTEWLSASARGVLSLLPHGIRTKSGIQPPNNPHLSFPLSSGNQFLHLNVKAFPVNSKSPQLIFLKGKKKKKNKKTNNKKTTFIGYKGFVSLERSSKSPFSNFMDFQN